MDFLEKIVCCGDVFAADVHDERFEAQPDEAVVGFWEGEEGFVDLGVAHVNPDGFVFLSGAGPEVNATGAGGGGVVVFESVNSCDEGESELVDVAFFAFVQFGKKSLFVILEIG